MHYYQPKYQKPNLIYQERPPSHPDTSGRTENPTENPASKNLENLKKYLKNTPEIITGDRMHDSSRSTAISTLEHQLTLTLSKDPLYSELKTLLDFIISIQEMHKFIFGINNKEEEIKNIIDGAPDVNYLAEKSTFYLIRIYLRTIDLLSPYIPPNRSPKLDLIIEKYLHPEAVSYIKYNIFNGGFIGDFQKAKKETAYLIEKMKAILIARGDRIENFKKRLRENPNIFQAGDTTIQDLLEILQNLPDDRRDNDLLYKVKKLVALRDHLRGTSNNHLNGRLMILRQYAKMLKEGSASSENTQSGPAFLQETLNLAEKLFGQNSEYRQLILSSQDLLHPSVIQFIQDAPPLRELYELKREIDKYSPQR